MKDCKHFWVGGRQAMTTPKTLPPTTIQIQASRLAGKCKPKKESMEQSCVYNSLSRFRVGLRMYT
jgi:hypothetical protein